MSAQQRLRRSSGTPSGMKPKLSTVLDPRHNNDQLFRNKLTPISKETALQETSSQNITRMEFMESPAAKDLWAALDRYNTKNEHLISKELTPKQKTPRRQLEESSVAKNLLDAVIRYNRENNQLICNEVTSADEGTLLQETVNHARITKDTDTPRMSYDRSFAAKNLLDALVRFNTENDQVKGKPLQESPAAKDLWVALDRYNTENEHIITKEFTPNQRFAKDSDTPRRQLRGSYVARNLLESAVHCNTAIHEGTPLQKPANHAGITKDTNTPRMNYCSSSVAKNLLDALVRYNTENNKLDVTAIPEGKPLQDSPAAKDLWVALDRYNSENEHLISKELNATPKEKFPQERHRLTGSTKDTKMPTKELVESPAAKDLWDALDRYNTENEQLISNDLTPKQRIAKDSSNKKLLAAVVRYNRENNHLICNEVTAVHQLSPSMVNKENGTPKRKLNDCSVAKNLQDCLAHSNRKSDRLISTSIPKRISLQGGPTLARITKETKIENGRPINNVASPITGGTLLRQRLSLGEMSRFNNSLTPKNYSSHQKKDSTDRHLIRTKIPSPSFRIRLEEKLGPTTGESVTKVEPLSKSSSPYRAQSRIPKFKSNIRCLN